MNLPVETFHKQLTNHCVSFHSPQAKACFQAICNLHAIIKEGNDAPDSPPPPIPVHVAEGFLLCTKQEQGVYGVFQWSISSIKVYKIPAFQHLLSALCIYQVSSGVAVEIKIQVSGQNSPWGLSPAAACGVGSVFFWPLQGHCDKSDTGLLQRGAVESQRQEDG